MSLPTCEHTDKHGEEVVTEELDAFINLLDVNVPRPLPTEPLIVTLSSALSPQEIQLPHGIGTHFTFTSDLI